METEYVVLKLSAHNDYKKYATDDQDNGLVNLIALLEDHGYREYASNNVLVIYHKE